jgi:hypothetical protein
MPQFLQSHDISMTTPSNLSTIMEMKRAFKNIYTQDDDYNASSIGQ